MDAIVSAAVLALCVTALVSAWRVGPTNRLAVANPRALSWWAVLVPVVSIAALLGTAYLGTFVPQPVRVMAFVCAALAALFVWLPGRLAMGETGREYMDNPRGSYAPAQVPPEQRWRVAALVILGVFGALIAIVGYMVGRWALAGLFN